MFSGTLDTGVNGSESESTSNVLCTSDARSWDIPRWWLRACDVTRAIETSGSRDHWLLGHLYIRRASRGPTTPRRPASPSRRTSYSEDPPSLYTSVCEYYLSSKSSTLLQNFLENTVQTYTKNKRETQSLSIHWLSRNSLSWDYILREEIGSWLHRYPQGTLGTR